MFCPFYLFCIWQCHLICWLTAGSGAFGVWQVGRICGDCSKYKFFRCDGRRGDILFLQKNLQVNSVSDFGRLAEKRAIRGANGTTEQLQICSFKRNDSLLPVCWKKDKYQDKDHKSICFCFGTWYNKFAYT